MKRIRNLLAGLMMAAGFVSPLHAVKFDTGLPSDRFAELSLPRSEGNSQDLAAGLNNQLWVTQTNPPQLIRLSPIGEMSKMALPKNSMPRGVVADKKGWVWVALEANNSIAQIDAKSRRVVKEFSLVQAGMDTVGPHSLAIGTDGTTVWFTGKAGNVVGKLNPVTGAVTAYPLPTPNSHPTDIVTASDGKVWFTQLEGDRIGHVTPDGLVFEFPVLEGTRRPNGIAADPNTKQVWFTVEQGGVFSSLDSEGNTKSYAVPSPNAALSGLAFDRQGRLWLAYRKPDVIGFVRPNFSVKEYPLSTENAGVSRITLGPDGNIWFIEQTLDRAGFVLFTKDYN